MSKPLLTTNEPMAEEIHELLGFGILNRVKIDYANPAAYLHAMIWSFRRDHWEAVSGPMPTRDEINHWVEGIIELSIGDNHEE